MMLFNLAHDTMVKFDHAGLCRITSLSQDSDEAAIVLDKRGQLLLLDALCHMYSFESPVESLVTKHFIEPDEDAEAYTTTLDADHEV